MSPKFAAAGRVAAGTVHGSDPGTVLRRQCRGNDYIADVCVGSNYLQKATWPRGQWLRFVKLPARRLRPTRFTPSDE